MRNTLLADAPAGTGNCTNNGGTLASLGSNLSDDASCAATFNQAGDESNVEPLIGPLQNNGGPTQTRALLPGSPAIDGVVGACTVAADQRAVARPKDDAPIRRTALVLLAVVGDHLARQFLPCGFQ